MRGSSRLSSPARASMDSASGRQSRMTTLDARVWVLRESPGRAPLPGSGVVAAAELLGGSLSRWRTSSVHALFGDDTGADGDRVVGSLDSQMVPLSAAWTTFAALAALTARVTIAPRFRQRDRLLVGSLLRRRRLEAALDPADQHVVQAQLSTALDGEEDTNALPGEVATEGPLGVKHHGHLLHALGNRGCGVLLERCRVGEPAGDHLLAGLESGVGDQPGELVEVVAAPGTTAMAGSVLVPRARSADRPGCPRRSGPRRRAPRRSRGRPWPARRRAGRRSTSWTAPTAAIRSAATAANMRRFMIGLSVRKGDDGGPELGARGRCPEPR